MWYLRQGKHLTDLFQVNEKRLGFWLCSKYQEDDANVHKAIQHCPIFLPFTISDWTGTFWHLKKGWISSCTIWSICMRSQMQRAVLKKSTLKSHCHAPFTPLFNPFSWGTTERQRSATDLRRKTEDKFLSPAGAAETFSHHQQKPSISHTTGETNAVSFPTISK